MSLQTTFKKWIIVSSIIFSIVLFTGFKGLISPPPGLFNAEAIGPFINNNLPNQRADGDINASPIYTNIDWISPIVAIPFPNNNNMLIVEMDGRFFSVSSNENTSSRTTVLDIQDRSWYYNWNANNNNTKHGGIQNVVFHPQFGMGQGKDYMYVYYIHNENNDAANAAEQYYDRLSRFTWNGNNFNPNSELILINQYDTRKGHDGSGMFFGTDGFLYVSVGDEGNSENVSQQLDFRFRCGVWRIDVDKQGGNISHPIIRQPSNTNVPTGATPSYTQEYYIPNDNPWVNPNGSILEEYYAHGLRQPFRMTQDAATGNIWIGDVGSGRNEEIDLIDKPGLNFQWDYKEGFSNGRNPTPNQIIGEEREPILELSHDDGWSAVIGGWVYTGSAIPQLTGKYIYANNGNNGNIYALTHTSGNTADAVELIATKPDAGGTFTGISSFGLDQNNEMLVLKLGNNAGEGRIYKLTENTPNANLAFPDKLSQTGVFSNLQNLIPNDGIIPYEVNNPLWSAGTVKKRWVAIPNDGNVNSNAERIGYSANNPWTFPIGTVFIKHFEQPDGKKLETRVWMHGVDGNWFGTTYQWNNAGTDADLLLEGAEEQITIDGETFDYLYPSVTQCQTCHLPSSGDVLGFRTHQLNKDILYPTTGLVGNQLETFAALGFIPNVNTNSVITSYALSDNSQSLELRARSYLDSNCSHCHNPTSGNRAAFDARYTTNFNNQNLLTSNVIESLGVTDPQIVAAQDLDRSLLYLRMNTTDGCCAMPPLAKGRIDVEGVQAVANWINSIDANCANNSTTTIGNALSDGNFIDGHNPGMNINEGDAYTNISGGMEQICIVDFNFYARRLGNPVTPFIARVNANNDFTILTVGQTRTSNQYSVGNNSFPFSDHSDDVLILQPGETIAIGFMDAFPTSPDNKIQSVIPADQGANEDEVWQTFTATSTTNPALFPTLTVGESPGLGTQGPANLNRSYKFNIGIQVGELTNTRPAGAVATLYSNCGYAGASISLAKGDYSNISNEGFSNNILSSLEIADGFEVTLYAQTNFGGNSITLTADASCLLADAFNDDAASMKVNCLAHNLPGRIEAEDFCTQFGVEAEETGDVGGGQNIGFVAAGDWMEYQINVSESGTYQVDYRIAARNASGGIIQLQVNGSAVGSINIPSTGGWQNFATVSNEVQLTAGTNTLRVFAQQAGWNLNWVEFNINNQQSFIPDPNKTYYLDVPDHNLRLAATGQSEDAYTTSTNTTGADVEWRFVDKGNDFWHLQRAAGGSTPRLRTDNSANADMQETSSSGVYTYYRFDHGDASGTHYITLPDGPTDFKRLQMNPQGEILFTSTTFGGGWVSWEITEVQNPQSFIPDPNKAYYLDVPAHNLRLAATGQSQDPYTTSTNTVGADVEWRFVDKGNGFWHIRRAAGGANPGLRTDNTANADMQASSSVGDYTYYRFDHGNTSGLHYITLPDGPTSFQRLQMNPQGDILFTGSGAGGTWVSWKITEAAQATFHQNCNYSGTSISLGTGEYPSIADEGLAINNLSSLRIPDGFQVTLFWGFNFSGGSITLTADDNCLINNSFNDITNSLIIEPVALGTRALQRELSVTPIFGQKSKLQWYFSQEATKKVKQYLIKHSSSEEEEMQEISILPAEDSEGLIAYDFVHQFPSTGINYYQVVVQYEDGTENYQLVGDVSFQEKVGLVQISPNPTDGNLFIDLSRYMDKSVYYFVNSTTGKQVLEGTWDASHNDTVELDLENIQNGLYVLYVKPDKERATALKFVISKDY